jgi:hypothetical protein
VITDRDRANVDEIQLDSKTTETLTDKILQRKEVETAKSLFTTTSWGNNASATTATSWAYNTTTSAPIQNVLSATSVVILNSGKMPNKMIIGRAIFDALHENPNVYNRIQYVEKAILTKELLASLFDVDTVEVGQGMLDVGREGIAESLTSIWGGNALLVYMSPRGGMKELSGAMMLEIGPSPYKVKKWREEAVGGDIIEVSSMFVPKLVATQCGYYFSNFSIV